MRRERVWRRFLWAAGGHAVLGAAFFWWTSLGLATPREVARSAAVALVWLFGLVAVEAQVFQGARWRSALRRSRFWWAALLVLGSLAAARAMVTWIPNVPGVGWQLTSAGLRFGLAWLLVHAAWAGLGWQATDPPVEDLLSPVARQ